MKKEEIERIDFNNLDYEYTDVIKCYIDLVMSSSDTRLLFW